MWISRPFPTPRSPLHLLSLLLLSARILGVARADDDDDDDDQPVLKDNSANCTCYTLDSNTESDMSDSAPYYFTYHRFWDFRALATSADQYAGGAPDPVTDDEDEGMETVTDADAAYLNGSAWNRDWGIQNWGKEATDDFPVRMQNSPRNVYICEFSPLFFFLLFLSSYSFLSSFFSLFLLGSLASSPNRVRYYLSRVLSRSGRKMSRTLHKG